MAESGNLFLQPPSYPMTQLHQYLPQVYAHVRVGCTKALPLSAGGLCQVQCWQHAQTSYCYKFKQCLSYICPDAVIHIQNSSNKFQVHYGDSISP